jgi:hypothetical protein
MKIYIVIRDGDVLEVFDNEMNADKFIVMNGQIGLDKVIKEIK